MTEFTFAEKRKECDRELGQRRHVYPRLIAAGKLTNQRSERQIAIMEAIAADYRRLAESEAKAASKETELPL